MFDPETEALLREAPALDGLSPQDLPELFTEAFARLAAARVRGDFTRESPSGWSIEAIADVYELIATTSATAEIRVPAAFVAATAQQLLAQAGRLGRDDLPPPTLVTRDAVAPEVSAPLLFLIARQYADAADAASRIVLPAAADDPFGRRLLRALSLLGRGMVASLADLPSVDVERSPDLFARSEESLKLALLQATKLVAAALLGADIAADPRALIQRIILACDGPTAGLSQPISSFPGYQQTARLLLLAFDEFAASALVGVPTPPRVNPEYWEAWVRHRARTAPFVWPNHRGAVEAGFHNPGTSAVLVLPTGAGKTSLASMKIASALGQGSRVVVLAPTHALVEQLTHDFDAVFVKPADAAESQPGSISVMTPEHCLASMSFQPDAFDDVSLVVFDEAHLLSMESGTRRSIDAMLAVLMLTRRAPSADLLFLSAMLRNGEELASWVGAITGRPSMFFEPLWKPSRQARGVVMYRSSDLAAVRAAAAAAQAEQDRRAGSIATTLRARAREQLRLEPFGLVGLQHNWLKESSANVTIQQLIDSPVAMDGKLDQGTVKVMPSVNRVAVALAQGAARSGLKSIVFANVKSHTVAIAREIRELIPIDPDSRDGTGDDELWEDLAIELGGLEHAFNSPGSSAVCHNSMMLRVERMLAERAFRRPNGAKVIVATPTLAQGMNLPADLAILASEMRASAQRGREALAAHELMNAAARAGRAGHVANGLVILISETILGFEPGGPLGSQLVGRLEAILPGDDRSIDLIDPLQHVLDRLSTGRTQDPDVEYMLNRLSLESVVDSPHAIGVADRSFAAFQAARTGIGPQFHQQIQLMQQLVAQRSEAFESDESLRVAGAQTGLSLELLETLRARLDRTVEWPNSASGWVSWAFDWFRSDERVTRQLFGTETGAMAQAVGRPLTHELTPSDMNLLEAGVHAWMSGAPLQGIERALGSTGDGRHVTCMRARSLVTKAIPLSVTFATSVVGLVASGMQRELSTKSALVLDCLVPSVREGFDQPSLVAFAQVEGQRSLRVRNHLRFRSHPGLPALEELAESLADLVPLVREHLVRGE